jgi:transposase
MHHVGSARRFRSCLAACTHSKEHRHVRGCQNSNGRLVTAPSEKFDAGAFLLFLQQLLRHWRRNSLMIAVVDNARWHHAIALQSWVGEHRHRLRLDFLPPYSPELNPVERVWKLTRRLCTRNRYFPDLKDLVHAVSEQFKTWSKPNSILYRLCAMYKMGLIEPTTIQRKGTHNENIQRESGEGKSDRWGSIVPVRGG